MNDTKELSSAVLIIPQNFLDIRVSKRNRNLDEFVSRKIGLAILSYLSFKKQQKKVLILLVLLAMTTYRWSTLYMRLLVNLLIILNLLHNTRKNYFLFSILQG